jgi:hypothetical protein
MERSSRVASGVVSVVDPEEARERLPRLESGREVMKGWV